MNFTTPKKIPIWTASTLLLLLGFIWGSGYTLAGLAMTNQVTPLGYAFWQSVGPALLTTLLCYFSHIQIPFSWIYIRYYSICAIFGITLPNTIMYYAVGQHLPSGITAVLMNTTPIITCVLAFLFRQERFSFSKFLGVSLAIAGMMGITFLKQDMSGHVEIHWIFITFIAPLCFSLCALYATRYRPENSESLAVSAGMLILSSLLLTPVVLATRTFYPLSTPFTLAEWVIIIEILLSSLGYILLFQLLKISGAIYYSLVSGVVVLTGLFWGWLIFDETLSLPLSASIGCILIGILWVTRRSSK